MRRLLAVAVLVAAFGPAASAHAAACVSDASGDWGDPATWTSCGGGVPGSGDSASIVSGHDVSVNSARSVASLSLASGATLSFGVNSPIVSVAGAMNATGGTITGVGRVEVAGLFTKSTANPLTIGSNAALVLDGDGAVAGGTIDLNTGDPLLQINGTFTLESTNANAAPIGGAATAGLVIGSGGVLVDQQAGDTSILVGYVNRGEIRAEAGLLELVFGTQSEISTGTYEATDGDVLELDDDNQIQGIGAGDRAALEGAGTIDLGSGTTTVGAFADITAANLVVDSATLDVSGSGQYAPGSLVLIDGTIVSTRDGSATTLTAFDGTLEGDHTFTPATFEKKGGDELAIADGTDLVLNGTATHIGGSVCLRETTPGVSGDPSLQINTTYFLPDAVTNAMPCNQGTDDAAHLIIGPGGTLERFTPGSTHIHTRTRVAGGTLAPPADVSFGFSNEVEMSSGSITVAPNGSMSADELDVTGGTVTIGADGELFSSSAPLTLDGGVLSGEGAVKGDGVTNTSGVVRPGSSPGTLTVDGPFTQEAGGTLELEVDGPAAGQFDALAVAGAATLDGTVALVGPGYQPADGDVIPFLTAATRTGEFATLTGGALAQGRTWELKYDGATPGARLVVHVPPPSDTGTPPADGTPPSTPTTPPAPTPPMVTPPTATPPATTPAPTAEETRLAAASGSAVAKALGLPRRACLSRRRFSIRIREPRGVDIRSATVTVAGKRIKARLRNGRWTATVDLRGLRKGRYAVRIVVRTVSGKTLTGKRRYGTCGGKRRRGGVPEL
jgi:hypothetical protein